MNIAKRGSVTDGLGALAVEVVGQTVYVADGIKGLQSFDITVGNNPVKTFEVPMPGTARGIASLQSSIILADDDDGIRTFRTSSSGLVQDAWLQIEGEAVGVAVLGSRIFVAAGDGGVRIIQVQADQSLKEIGSIPTKDFCWGCDALGSVLYSANDGAGVDIIDVGSETPSVISTLNIGGEVFGVTAINNESCLVCNGRDGVSLVDVRNPAKPTIVSQATVNGEARKARIRGNTCLVAAGFGGVAVLDLSNPQKIIVTKNIPNKNFAWEADASCQYVYIADGSSGLLVGTM